MVVLSSFFLITENISYNVTGFYFLARICVAPGEMGAESFLMVAYIFHDCLYVLESVILFFFSLYFFNVKCFSTNMLNGNRMI